MENDKVANKITRALHGMNMKHNLKTLGEVLDETYPWYIGKPLFKIIKELHEVEKELREHYEEYKKLKKPPEHDETWYCLQYLELLVEEILGE